MIGLEILLTAFLFISCNTVMANEMVLASNSQVITTSTGENLWKGEPKGYVSLGDPTTDSVALLAQLGRVHAAIGRANSHNKEKGMIIHLPLKYWQAIRQLIQL